MRKGDLLLIRAETAQRPDLVSKRRAGSGVPGYLDNADFDAEHIVAAA